MGGFVGKASVLFASGVCATCSKTWFAGISEFLGEYFPGVFWWHVGAAALISLLGPFQFTEKVRKWRKFQLHRLIGRTVLVASCIHQASATYMCISNIFFNRAASQFPTSVAANYVYAFGFVAFNIYS